MARIYLKFDERIPPFKRIKKQFKELTGERLSLNVSLNLTELHSNSNLIINLLYTDKNKYDEFIKTNSPSDSFWNKYDNINSIGFPSFSSIGFYKVDYFVLRDNIIQIDYLANQFYFPISIIKTLLKLDAQVVDSDFKIIENWKIPRKWEKLKKWEDYQWYNRPKR